MPKAQQRNQASTNYQLFNNFFFNTKKFSKKNQDQKTTQHTFQSFKMMKAVAARIGLKKATRPFKDFYEEWIETLKNILLPHLRRSMLVSSANHLSTHVQMLHHHFQTYYYALDLAASEDISQLLYPTWRNTLEKPFLWFADFHPNLFINLLRSFLNQQQQDSEIIERNHEKVLKKFKTLTFPFAWNTPSDNLLSRIEQIECGLRLMVPTFVTRARKAQGGFINKVAVDWVRCEGKQEASKVIGGAVVANMEELVSVFLDANRLRRSILTEIMGATDVYQAALYLEGLANFFVGFKDCELLKEFEQYKIPI
ncbi:hypothetical protein AQUCO_01300700v1 [Aquilegia coerulea]|uniref:DOG1 domain-containing protein n=1 Tax=Aquilegia coerulea TaxID=218851 RepID=A0A2G5E2Y6_AQUCA|nr:hypothetical protein AQUCO_01300700v1 [Aquilegia coerulea]